VRYGELFVAAVGEVSFDRGGEAGEPAVALHLAESGLGFVLPAAVQRRRISPELQFLTLRLMARVAIALGEVLENIALLVLHTPGPGLDPAHAPRGDRPRSRTVRPAPRQFRFLPGS